MKNKILVYDFETDLPNPIECNVTQIAGLVIDPYRLEIIPNAVFSIKVKPPTIDDEDYFTDERKKTIAFHCRNNNCTEDALLYEWRSSTNEELAWKSFTDFVNRFNNDNKDMGAPIACGANIEKFDNIIAARLNEKYGVKRLFHKRDVYDVQKITKLWLENLSDEPYSYSMDSLRDYFGIAKEGAHNALKDVEDSAAILIKFLNFHRKCAKNVKFRGSFKKVVAA